MPDEDVKLKAVFVSTEPQYTYDPDTRELHLLSGDFNWDNKWGGDVNKDEVLSVTADEGVRFVGECSFLFDNLSSCRIMELSAVDTSGATSMAYMFSGCGSLTELDLSGFDTSNVTDMGCMFFNCGSLASLNLSGFDTFAVTDMSSMFENCTNLISVDLTGFDTSSVTKMNGMFYGCRSLISLDLSGFDTTSVKKMDGMLYDCTSLKTLDIRGFTVGGETEVGGLFYQDYALCRLTLSPYMSVTESMQLNKGRNDSSGWIVEDGDTNVVFGSNSNPGIEAPDQITTYVWKEMPDSIFTGHSLSLGGDIGLNFYLDSGYVSAGDIVNFEWAVKGEQKTASYTLTEDDSTIDGCRAICPISAADMTYPVKATVEGYDDRVVYSAAEYAYYILDHVDENWDYYDAADMVKAMLNYGAAAQVYFGRNTGDLANRKMSDEDKALGEVTAEMLAEKAYNGNASLPAGVDFTKVTLSLKSETTLSLYFTSEKELTFSCNKDKNVEVEHAGTTYAARIRGISAKNLGDDFTLTVSDGTNSGAVTYSPMTYCYNVLKRGTNDENLKNVVTALYWYWQKAAEYFDNT